GIAFPAVCLSRNSAIAKQLSSESGRRFKAWTAVSPHTRPTSRQRRARRVTGPHALEIKRVGVKLAIRHQRLPPKLWHARIARLPKCWLCYDEQKAPLCSKL